MYIYSVYLYSMHTLWLVNENAVKVVERKSSLFAVNRNENL